jgi:hypothetical protein
MPDPGYPPKDPARMTWPLLHLTVPGICHNEFLDDSDGVVRHGFVPPWHSSKELAQDDLYSPS